MSGHFTCAICGKTHEGLPTDWAFTLPDVVWAIPVQQRVEVARFTDDLCEYGDRYFLRGLLQTPFRESEGYFGWGVWAEVDVSVFERYLELYDADGSAEPLHAGMLANGLPVYRRSLGVPVRIRFRDETQRPVFICGEQDRSDLASEQRSGIGSARYHQILEAIGVEV